MCYVRNFVFLFFSTILIIGGCGTGIGNIEANSPDDSSGNYENEPTISSENFDNAIEEYNNLSGANAGVVESVQNENDESQSLDTDESDTSLKYDCGKITDSTSEEEELEKRECFFNSFNACSESIILLDKTTVEGRLVSFGQVKLDCSLYIHTVGNDPEIFNDDISQTCSSLSLQDNFEYSCGIK